MVLLDRAEVETKSEFNIRDEANGLPNGIVATARKSEGRSLEVMLAAEQSIKQDRKIELPL